MKKMLCLLLIAMMLTGLYGCGAAQPEQAPTQETAAWTRDGYYSGEDGGMLSVTRMEDLDPPAWYVGFLNGGDSYGGILQQEGNSLHGTLSSGGEKGDLTVTVSEDGEDGLQIAAEGGEIYHFTPMEMPTASIFVTINTEASGSIAYAEGETAPEIDPEHPCQSAQINLAEPAAYTFAARPEDGSAFVKWTKNGEDFSTEPQITVLLDESADFVAVFEMLPMPDADESAAQIANPWRDSTEDEAAENCPRSFVVPDGAENVQWSMMDSAADPSGIPGALIQLSFDLNGNSFTAREQLTGDTQIDQSGMYYDWTVEEESVLQFWADGAMPCRTYRYIGENEFADLCTWYDAEAGISYSLSVAAEDLDGFDIEAVAGAMCG